MTVFSSINQIACAPQAPGSFIHTDLGSAHVDPVVSADIERGQGASRTTTQNGETL